MDEDFDDMPIQIDPVAARGDVLIRLAAAVDRAVDEDTIAFLKMYMGKVVMSIKLPPQADLVAIKGGMN